MIRAVRAPRMIGIAVALAIAAWFAIGARQAIDTDKAASIISSPSPLTLARAAHASSLLHDAGWLNPDREVDILKGRLLLRDGNPAAARAALLTVAKAEPPNAAAWAAFGSASADDRQGFLLALARINALVPPVPEPH